MKDLSSEEVARKLYPATSMGQQYSMPDYEWVHKEMQKSGVTLSLLWVEYCERCRQNGELPYKSTQFNKYYAGYADIQASVENIEYIAERHLDREQILRLASCSYIQEARNVIILGATGAGKTFLACSLGVAASRNFYAARYLRLPDLLVEIAVARRDGTYREYMKHLKKVKLLILDGLLYPLKEAEARDVLELVEARNKVASTIFCSQYGTSEWHENLYDPTLADAICDRIMYNAYTVQIEGESMRKRMGMTE